MEINDYSSRLAEARTDYQNKANELRDSYDKRLGDIENKNELQRKKQSDNYTQSKLGLEEKQADYINDYSTQTKETIEDRTREYQKNLEREKFSFNEDRNRIKEGFDRKLSELSKTYSTREKEMNEYSDHRLKTTKNRYDNQVERLNDQFQEDLDKTSYSAENSLKQQQASQNREKRRILSDHDQEMRGVIKDESIAKAKAQESFSKSYNSLRETQGEQLNQLKNYHAQSTGEIKKVKDDETKDLSKNFRELSNEISNRNQKQRREEVKTAADHKKTIEKDFAKDLYTAKREMSERLRGGDKSDILKDKLNHTVDSYEGRIKNIYEKLDDERYTGRLDKERMAESFMASNRDLKAKNARTLDKSTSEIRDFARSQMIENKNNADKAIDQYKKELTKSELRNEANAFKSREYNKKVLDNQRKVFGETVNSLNDRNRSAVTQLQSQFSKDKTSYIEETKKQHHQDMAETKLDLKRMMTNKENSLMERNNQLKRVNEKLVDQYEGKIDRIEKKANNEMRRMQEVFKDQKEAQDVATRRLLESKERENDFEKFEIQNLYDKRLSDSKTIADKQLSKTVEYYEDLLTRERDESSRKLKIKVNGLQADYQKLYQQNELEKATLRTQFESRIDELRQANAEDLEEKNAEYKSKMFKNV